MSFTGFKVPANNKAKGGVSFDLDPENIVLNLTHAVWDLPADVPANARVTLFCQTDDSEDSYAVCSLSRENPSCSLDLLFQGHESVTFSTSFAAGKWSGEPGTVHLTGYEELNPMADEGDDESDEAGEGDEDDEADEADDDEEEQAAAAAAAAELAAAASKKRKLDETAKPEAKKPKQAAGEAKKPAQAPAAAAAAQAKTQAPAAAAPAAKAKPQVITLKSGIQYADLEVGTGAEAEKGNVLRMRYKGLLETGKVFDTNMPKGRPFEFTLGGGDVIKGWDIGLRGMRVGGRRKLIIPPELGYGARGSPPQIPKNATLIFEVQLLSMKA